ncbi:MAG: hypothetical protein ACOZCL_05315 [Bacillota bacterium]
MPDKINKKSGFDLELYKACERLVQWGLVDHIHKPIPIELNEELLFRNRIDRNINQWGETFLDVLVNSKVINPDIFNGIKDTVFKIQNNGKDELIALIKKQTSMRVKDRAIAREEVTNIEVKLKAKEVCLFKFK